MLDNYNRKIDYLRISVTDRCNLRCVYCMPEDGVEMLDHNEILNFDEIIEVTKAAVRKGVEKVRITGGEPLVRNGIVDLVKMIGEIEGIKDYSNWPTIPQLYVDGEFIGGCDICVELFQSGELESIVKKA